MAVESGLLSRLILDGRIKGKILVHNSIIKRLEHKALNGDFRGVEELEHIRRYAESLGLRFEILNGDSNIDPKEALREVALKTDSIIVTPDYVSAAISKALGIKVLHERAQVEKRLEDFFNDGTMSVHLKEGVPPRVKKGKPGRWTFEVLHSKPLSRKDIEDIVNDILNRARAGEGFIETDRNGSSIIQLGTYRIVIT
ncbi:MAG: ATPase, partial [Candidatus Bathyarchaeia archaeon]